jgi:hypothetical protein
MGQIPKTTLPYLYVRGPAVASAFLVGSVAVQLSREEDDESAASPLPRRSVALAHRQRHRSLRGRRCRLLTSPTDAQVWVAVHFSLARLEAAGACRPLQMPFR